MDKNRPNGCGPYWLPDIIPDGPEGRFLSPCNEHDLLYNLGGGWKEKHFADFLLFKRSCQAVKNLPILKRILGYAWASVYLVFVLIFGFTSFNFFKRRES